MSATNPSLLSGVSMLFPHRRHRTIGTTYRLSYAHCFFCVCELVYQWAEAFFETGGVLLSIPLNRSSGRRSGVGLPANERGTYNLAHGD